MLPNDQSPIYHLVLPWQSSKLPSIDLAPAMRIQLFNAAREEMELSIRQELVPSSPMHDPRFIWANQWLDVALGGRRTVDADVQFLFQVRMNPKPFLEQDLDAISTDDEPDPGNPTIPFPGS